MPTIEVNLITIQELSDILKIKGIGVIHSYCYISVNEWVRIWGQPLTLDNVPGKEKGKAKGTGYFNCGIL